jgi:DnaJ-class molecular chaperone
MHHPDKGGDHDLFCRITEAGSVLTDAERRRAYDARLRLLMEPCAKCDGSGIQWITMSFTQRTSRRCAVCKGVGYFTKE